ncbi:RNA-binding S4 domain-containing protein [Arcanobacterium hippocoleae]
MHDFVLRLPIKLSQFLKLANLAENGAHAKELIHSEFVQVNGEVETRAAHPLNHGDKVTIYDGRNNPVTLRVVSE